MVRRTAARISRRPEAMRAKLVSRTDLAYRSIKDRILSNRLHPGEAVPLDRFVRELRLSRTPVREAILKLAKEGLIEIRPRMGTFVSHLDLRQIQEMYQVRSLLEGHAARLAAALAPIEQLAAVELELRTQKTEGEIDCKVISDAGQTLHRLIINSCGNRVLTQMILSVRDHFVRFRTLSLQIPEKVLSSHGEHLAILEALKERNPELAEQRTREHLQHAGRYLLESLLRPSADATVPRVTIAAGD